MNDFDEALSFSLKWEGGDAVTNHPADKGGLTKWGISQAANPDLDIANLTYEDAQRIYRERYWVPGGCDVLPYPVNITHFDACVNHRMSTAVKLLQRGAGALADGVLGPKTLSAVQAMNPHLLAIAMITERERYYRGIVENDPTQAVFLRGWLNRAADLMELVRKGS